SKWCTTSAAITSPKVITAPRASIKAGGEAWTKTEPAAIPDFRRVHSEGESSHLRPSAAPMNGSRNGDVGFDRRLGGAVPFNVRQNDLTPDAVGMVAD